MGGKLEGAYSHHSRRRHVVGFEPLYKIRGVGLGFWGGTLSVVVYLTLIEIPGSFMRVLRLHASHRRKASFPTFLRLIFTWKVSHYLISVLFFFQILWSPLRLLHADCRPLSSSASRCPVCTAVQEYLRCYNGVILLGYAVIGLPTTVNTDTTIHPAKARIASFHIRYLLSGSKDICLSRLHNASAT